MRYFYVYPCSVSDTSTINTQTCKSHWTFISPEIHQKFCKLENFTPNIIHTPQTVPDSNKKNSNQSTQCHNFNVTFLSYFSLIQFLASIHLVHGYRYNSKYKKTIYYFTVVSLLKGNSNTQNTHDSSLRHRSFSSKLHQLCFEASARLVYLARRFLFSFHFIRKMNEFILQRKCFVPTTFSLMLLCWLMKMQDLRNALSG